MNANKSKYEHTKTNPISKLNDSMETGEACDYSNLSFSTQKYQFTIQDSCGHSHFMSNLISGATSPDIGILIVSAELSKLDENEIISQVGLAKDLGLERLFVCINQMDAETISWEQKIFEEIVFKIK